MVWFFGATSALLCKSEQKRQPEHPAIPRGCSYQQDPSWPPRSADKESPIHDIRFCTTAAWIKEGFLVLETP